MLSTAYYETAATMQPVHEYGGNAYFTRSTTFGDAPQDGGGDGQHATGRRDPLLRARLRPVDLEEQLRRMGRLLGVDLVVPRSGDGPKTAIRIMFRGMTDPDPRNTFPGSTPALHCWRSGRLGRGAACHQWNGIMLAKSPRRRRIRQGVTAKSGEACNVKRLEDIGVRALTAIVPGAAVYLGGIDWISIGISPGLAALIGVAIAGLGSRHNAGRPAMRVLTDTAACSCWRPSSSRRFRDMHDYHADPLGSLAMKHLGIIAAVALRSRGRLPCVQPSGHNRVRRHRQDARLPLRA